MRLAAVCLVVALLAPTATSQVAAKFTGRVVKVAGTPCDPTATHQVACTGVLLKSSVVNLTSLEGRITLLEGTVAVGSCITVDVTAASTPQYSHTVTSPGGFRLDTDVRFRATSPFLGVVALVLAGDSTFFPLGEFGAYMLDPITSLLISIETALLGSFTWTIRIPNDLSLVNATIYSQTLWANILANPVTGGLVNSECFTILR